MIAETFDFAKEKKTRRKSVRAKVAALQKAGDPEMRNPVTSLALWIFILASGACSLAGVVYSYGLASIVFLPLAFAAIILGARMAVQAARAATGAQRLGCIAILILCTAVNAWGEHRALESLNDYVRAPYDTAQAGALAADAEIAALRAQLVPVPVVPSDAAALAAIPAVRLRVIASEAEKARAANYPVQLKLDAAISKRSQIVAPHEPPGQIANWAMPIIIAASLIIHTLGFWAIGNAPAPVIQMHAPVPAPAQDKGPAPLQERAPMNAGQALAFKRWNRQPE